MSDTALERMERMYRPQIGFYDLTRKPYLLGRDRLLRMLPLKPGDRVCEVGCGTGRNLAILARRQPAALLFGLDASAAMLARAAEVTRARLVHGVAERLDPGDFGLGQPFDRIFFSYSLSMIPDGQGALGRAMASLCPGGVLAIVDFGRQQGLPPPFKRLLRAWLSLFHVHPVDAMQAHLDGLAAGSGSRLRHLSVAGGYAELFFLRKGRI